MNLPTEEDYRRVLDNPDLFKVALGRFHEVMGTRFGYRNHRGKLISELHENLFVRRLKEGPFKHIKRLEVIDKAVGFALAQSPHPATKSTDTEGE